MTDDLDRDLMRVFAATAVALPADDFVRRLQLRIALRRPLQAVPRVAAVMVLFLVGALAAHALVGASVLAAEQLGALLVSPLGWTMSLLLTIVVARRWRLVRH